MSNFSVNLQGYSAFVTGAGEGIGKACAEALQQAGANVALIDLNPDRLDAIANDMREKEGGQVITFQGDVTNRFQVASMIERTRDEFGKVNILVNSAGIYKAQPMLKIDEWDWRRQIEVNITGTFFCTQLLARVMSDEGGGIIVNLASTAGHPNPIPSGIGYVASKAGIVGLTKQAALELGPEDIRVNAVCFGNVAGEGMPISDPIPNAQAKAGNPEDIANVVLFLCSDAAGFITGQCINVDGGENML